MNRELYFIPILQKAMEAGDVKTALKEAFYKINQFGKSDEYKQGFKNFQVFTKEVFAHNKLIEKGQTKDLKNYAQLYSVTKNCLRHELTIFRNGQPINTISLDKDRHQSIQGVLPGIYTLSLSTGRVLWRGNITTEDIIVNGAFDDNNMKLAADSKDSTPKHSKRIVLLNGQIIFKIFKGFKAGVIEIGLE